MREGMSVGYSFTSSLALKMTLRLSGPAGPSEIKNNIIKLKPCAMTLRHSRRLLYTLSSCKLPNFWELKCLKSRKTKGIFGTCRCHPDDGASWWCHIIWRCERWRWTMYGPADYSCLSTAAPFRPIKKCIQSGYRISGSSVRAITYSTFLSKATKTLRKHCWKKDIKLVWYDRNRSESWHYCGKTKNRLGIITTAWIYR